jgi:transcriptional regulator with XRE-family HTH domain
MGLAEYLKRLRKKKGWPQRQLAEHIVIDSMLTKKKILHLITQKSITANAV